MEKILNKIRFYSNIYFFIFCCLLKIILIFSFSSEYNSSLFYPFVNLFANEGVINPWQFYLEQKLNLDSFPYHSLMLLIHYPFSVLSDFFNIQSIFKLPLLFADILIFYVLIKILPHKKKKIFLLYFLNPIILYSTYIHFQLDIIPTALLFYSIYLLVKNKNFYSSILFGLALATKFHIIIALPLILFFLFKNKKLIVALKYLFFAIITCFLIDLPFLFSEGFIQMVLLNSKQTLLFDSFYTIGSANILFPVAAVLLVYFHFFNQVKVNNDLLYFYFGVLFTVLIGLIYSGSGWYVWMVPFLSMYFIKNDNLKNRLLYMSLSLSYLVFFITFYNSDYQEVLFFNNEIFYKIDNQKLSDLSFTILEVILLVSMLVFYKYGIKSNSIYNRKLNLVIGIGGDSGVGKTRLLKNLKSLLGDKILEIEGDGEHKWERGNDNWNKFTHLDPKANNIHKQSDAIYNLKHNKVIYRSDYDHDTGNFSDATKVLPKEFIIIAGLHPFYLPRLRKNIDLKIYIDTDENLRRHWKIIRDTRNRGYSFDKIIKQIEIRKSDTIKYIYPQKEFSDVVIKYYSLNSFCLGNENESISLGLRITIDANIHLESIVNKLKINFVWDYNDDLKTQFIEIESEPEINFQELAETFIPNINELTFSSVNWERGYEGLVQLILLIMISEKLKDNE